jgi:hypothetical protein
MSSHFGTGSGASRRRRRLILSADVCPESTAPVGPSTVRSEQPVQSSTPERTRLVTFVNSLIRPQPWISWLLSTVALISWTAVVVGGYQIDRGESGLKEVLGLRSGRACHVLSITSLLAVTQLSFVILWYRTRSRKDFHGRYRIWLWTSVTWSLFFAAAIFGWQQALTDAFSRRLPNFPFISAIAWLLPASILFGTSYQLLSREMARTPADRWMLRLSALTALTVAVLRLSPALVPAGWNFDLLNAAIALWPTLLACSLWHHARYVVHITNEASPFAERPNRVSPIVRQVWAEVLTITPSHSHLWTLIRSPRWRKIAIRGASITIRIARFAVSIATQGLHRLKLRKSDVPAPPSRKRTTEPLPTPSAAQDARKRPAQDTAKHLKSA